MYTQTNLEEIELAILSLAQGKRVVSISMNGRTVAYGPADIASLKSLRKEIKTELAKGRGRKKYALLISTKGL